MVNIKRVRDKDYEDQSLLINLDTTHDEKERCNFHFKTSEIFFPDDVQTALKRPSSDAQRPSSDEKLSPGTSDVIYLPPLI